MNAMLTLVNRNGRQRFAPIQLPEQPIDLRRSSSVLGQIRSRQRGGLHECADLQSDEVIDLALDGRGWFCHGKPSFKD
jgi:hypothetical protein